MLGPISLRLSAGESLALVGPSGSGKSTALRLLAGLEQPSEGTVELRLDRGETAVVFQAPTLMPWATSIENVALPLRIGNGRLPQEAARRALARVGLEKAADLKPAQLSGGMAMRVSLARALVANPRLLLLDEPFAALDEIARRTLADDILRLWEVDRPAMVFVTHNVEEAVYMAERVLVLSPGPGRIAEEIAVQGAFPRPLGFRAEPAFRAAAEAVSKALQLACQA